MFIKYFKFVKEVTPHLDEILLLLNRRDFTGVGFVSISRRGPVLEQFTSMKEKTKSCVDIVHIFKKNGLHGAKDVAKCLYKLVKKKISLKLEAGQFLNSLVNVYVYNDTLLFFIHIIYADIWTKRTCHDPEYGRVQVINVLVPEYTESHFNLAPYAGGAIDLMREAYEILLRRNIQPIRHNPLKL